MNKEPRLRFTEEERADPALEKPIRKADKAAAKADRAQAKIPKKKVRQVEIDQETGKTTTKLVLEDKKKPPSKLSHTLRDAPANMVAGKIHKEVRESEQDNVAWKAPTSLRKRWKPAHGWCGRGITATS